MSPVPCVRALSRAAMLSNMRGPRRCREVCGGGRLRVRPLLQSVPSPIGAARGMLRALSMLSTMERPYVVEDGPLGAANHDPYPVAPVIHDLGSARSPVNRIRRTKIAAARLSREVSLATSSRRSRPSPPHRLLMLAMDGNAHGGARTVVAVHARL